MKLTLPTVLPKNLTKVSEDKNIISKAYAVLTKPVTIRVIEEDFYIRLEKRRRRRGAQQTQISKSDRRRKRYKMRRGGK